jgi:glycerophosphoryl diester phosphodiesterase
MSRPLVIAHRTCPLDAPENSLRGIDVARAAGADAVEIDVRLTRDHVAVCVHDRIPRRTLGWRLPVELTTYDGLVGAASRAGVDPPLRLSTALAAADDIRYAVDVKASDAMRATLDIVSGVADREVMLWCRDAAALARVHAISPSTQTALLRNTTVWRGTRRYLADAAAAGVTAVSLHQRVVSRRSVDEAHRLGLLAYAWVLTEQAHVDVLACGVDGVVTDWPRTARALVSGRAAT